MALVFDIIDLDVASAIGHRCPLTGTRAVGPAWAATPPTRMASTIARIALHVNDDAGGLARIPGKAAQQGRQAAATRRRGGRLTVIGERPRP